MGNAGYHRGKNCSFDSLLLLLLLLLKYFTLIVKSLMINYSPAISNIVFKKQKIARVPRALY